MQFATLVRALLVLTTSALQQRADVSTGTVSSETGIKLANSVGITEFGYQLIASLKSDAEMKAFIHRVVAEEARYINDSAELNGFVQFYSGTHGVRNLDTMKKELRNAEWVSDGEGRNADLSEVGYQKVAKLKSKPHMLAFFRRILDSEFKKVSDERALDDLAPYYDGEVSVQNFDLLKHKLLSAPWVESRDDEAEALFGSTGQVSFAKHASTSQAEASVEESKPKKEELTTPEAQGGCDDWCSGDLFVKVEANNTVMKNLSSWSMKCDWAHCSGCGDCNDDPSARMAEKELKQKLEMSHAKKRNAVQSTCEDWCSSESFEVVKLNTTTIKEFSWEMKCVWQYCGGCSKCTAPQHAAPVSMRIIVAAESSQKSAREDPEVEEVVETTLATTTTAATTTVVTTTLATTTLATTTLATTTLATTTLATTTVLTTVVTTTLPTTTLPEEEEVTEEVELLEEAPTEDGNKDAEPKGNKVGKKSQANNLKKETKEDLKKGQHEDEDEVNKKPHQEDKDHKKKSSGKDVEKKHDQKEGKEDIEKKGDQKVGKEDKDDNSSHEVHQKNQTDEKQEQGEAKSANKHKDESSKGTDKKEPTKKDDKEDHGPLSWLFR